MSSLHRQKNAVVAKAVLVWADSFWERNGQNGDVYQETGVIGGTWTQREGIMSTLVPPECFGPFLATPEEEIEGTLLEEMAGASSARRPARCRPSTCAAGAPTSGRAATSPHGVRAM